MTICMETWCLADREALKAHYKHNLIEGRLFDLDNMEARNRHDVQESLKRATENCSNAYEKGTRSFEILSALNPDILEHLLPKCLVALKAGSMRLSFPPSRE